MNKLRITYGGQIVSGRTSHPDSSAVGVLELSPDCRFRDRNNSTRRRAFYLLRKKTGDLVRDARARPLEATMNLFASLLVGVSFATFVLMFVAGWIARQYITPRPR